MKNLGLKMDSKLNYVSDVIEAKERAMTRLSAVRCLAQNEWGSNPAMSSILIKPCVIPAPLYGSKF